MSVGVSEWSSSFQQVLQCGLRRLVPAEHFQVRRPVLPVARCLTSHSLCVCLMLQLFMIHHSTDKAQKRRLR